MQKFTLFILVSLALVASGNQFQSFDSIPTTRDQFFADRYPVWDTPMSRSRRVPSSGTEKMCGARLMKFVLHVCHESCSLQQGHDIATHCCHISCPEDYVKKNCCPLAV